MASADLLLHPVRLRIVKAFLGDRALTTTDLGAELADVPAGSLYRHVARLAKEGVLQVVAERRVRGTVERTYALRLLAARMGPAEAAAMSPDEHEQAFLAFVAGLLADFDRYLAATPDLVRDGVSYNVGAMWLSDEEHAALLRELAMVIQPRLANAQRKGRRRRMVYSVFLPGPETQAPRARSSPSRRSRPPSADGSSPRSKRAAPGGSARRSPAMHDRGERNA